MINVDMTEVSSLTLDNPAFTSLNLRVTPSGGGSEEEAAFTEINALWFTDKDAARAKITA